MTLHLMISAQTPTTTQWAKAAANPTETGPYQAQPRLPGCTQDEREREPILHERSNIKYRRRVKTEPRSSDQRLRPKHGAQPNSWRLSRLPIGSSGSLSIGSSGGFSNARTLEACAADW